ncbi:lysophospholipid acyltransferase family protein [Cryptosporangium minutisporangium]|uniref:Lysophospholipid acyltransferase family protein n=1 Tax=Cryptosporangium minutisporangium TaxID=113569 RepID=A0ABP6SWA6_9ACTN
MRCLGADEARVPVPVAALRLVGAFMTLLAALGLAVVHPLVRGERRAAIVRSWCRTLLWTLGVRVAADASTPSPTAALVVVNHISWLDVLAVASARPGRVVARADLRGWPLIGPVAARAGTIFVDRHRLSTLPGTVAEVRAALRAGARVLVFPEGTTWCGAEGGRFRPALFQAAIDAGAPIEPVTVSYRSAGRPSTAAAFVGDDPLVASIWRVARTRDLVADLRGHRVLAPTDDRGRLAAAAEGLVYGGRTAAAAIRPVPAARASGLQRPGVSRRVGVHVVDVLHGHPA